MGDVTLALTGVAGTGAVGRVAPCFSEQFSVSVVIKTERVVVATAAKPLRPIQVLT